VFRLPFCGTFLDESIGEAGDSHCDKFNEALSTGSNDPLNGYMQRTNNVDSFHSHDKRTTTVIRQSLHGFDETIPLGSRRSFPMAGRFRMIGHCGFTHQLTNIMRSLVIFVSSTTSSGPIRKDTRAQWNSADDDYRSKLTLP